MLSDSPYHARVRKSIGSRGLYYIKSSHEAPMLPFDVNIRATFSFCLIWSSYLTTRGSSDLMECASVTARILLPCITSVHVSAASANRHETPAVEFLAAKETSLMVPG